MADDRVMVFVVESIATMVVPAGIPEPVTVWPTRKSFTVLRVNTLPVGVSELVTEEASILTATSRPLRLGSEEGWGVRATSRPAARIVCPLGVESAPPFWTFGPTSAMSPPELSAEEVVIVVDSGSDWLRGAESVIVLAVASTATMVVPEGIPEPVTACPAKNPSTAERVNTLPAGVAKLVAEEAVLELIFAPGSTITLPGNELTVTFP